MSTPDKIRYHIALSDPVTIDPVSNARIRPLARSDIQALADLMLNAYVGTIDHEGETIGEAVAEIESWFGDSPLVEHSYGAVVEGVLASAVLVMNLDNLPFIAIVMTRSDSKQQGLGKYTTAVALGSLRDAGEKQAVLYITSGNTASEKLFLGLGAVRQPT